MTHFFPVPATEGERDVLRRAAEWNDSRGLDALTPEALRALTASEGCDFATALLHRKIVESAAHGPFLRVLGEGGDETPLPPVRVAIVPGAFYRENPRTGADGRIVREVAKTLGLPVEVVPLASTGGLEENARALIQWLSWQRDTPIILVSVSKGGGDVKMALAQAGGRQAFQRVIGWINLCGMLDGTPMADFLLSSNLLAIANRFVYRIRGRSLGFLTDLKRYPGCPLDFPLTLPPHLRVIHLVGFPLRHHLRNGLARRCHARLQEFGPNDGSILLCDLPRWPGQLCPVWGADHYLQPCADLRPLLATLLRRLAVCEMVSSIS